VTVIGAFDLKIAAALAVIAGIRLLWLSAPARRLVPMPWADLTRILNVIAVLALAISVGQSLSLAAAIPEYRRDTPPSVNGTSGATRPDIYVIVLDAYARHDTLQRALGFDNSAFVSALEALEFDVADQAHSNYNRTVLTLPSMLNGAHIADLIPAPLTGFRAQDRQLSSAINEALGFQVAMRSGYQVLVIPTQIGFMTPARHATVLDSGHLSQLEYLMPRNGFLNHFLVDEQMALFRHHHRERILAGFNLLVEIPSRPSDYPRLIFAHLMLPHNPIVFRADGSLAEAPECYWLDCRIEEPLDESLRAALVEQFVYTNERVVAVARAIIERSAEPPVVVFLGDHGIRHWASDRPEAFESLFASYTPGREDVFPETATPVNLFPRIFSAYAVGAMSEVPDTSWVLGHENGYFPIRRWDGVSGPVR
jgi:hypothetical protein